MQAFKNFCKIALGYIIVLAILFTLMINSGGWVMMMFFIMICGTLGSIPNVFTWFVVTETAKSVARQARQS